MRSEHGEITGCLDNQAAKLQMRPLRVVVDDLQYELYAAEKCLLLELRLPAGSYLTSLLDHFISVTEPGQGRF